MGAKRVKSGDLKRGKVGAKSGDLKRGKVGAKRDKSRNLKEQSGG